MQARRRNRLTDSSSAAHTRRELLAMRAGERVAVGAGRRRPVMADGRAAGPAAGRALTLDNALRDAITTFR